MRALAVLPTQALPAQVPAVFRQYDADTPLCVRLLGGDTVARGGHQLVAVGPRGPVASYLSVELQVDSRALIGDFGRGMTLIA